MAPTLLIVDDHSHYLATAARMLELHIPGAVVRTAGDGSTALSMVHQQPFELLILDYQLQTTTGSDLLRQLRARSARAGRPLPPVLMMSSQPDVALFARTAGADAFLPKPLLVEQIEATILPLLQQAGAQLTSRPMLWQIRQRLTQS